MTNLYDAQDYLPHQTRADDLLPCPFCGADAKVQYLHDSLGNNDTSISNIGCKNGCVHQSGFRQSSIAISAWNRRAALDTPAPALMDELVEALNGARETILHLIHARGSEAEGSDDEWTAEIDAVLAKCAKP